MTGPLRVEGVLDFTLTDAGSTSAGTVTGEGDRVTVHADDPVAALRAALGPGASKLLPTVAQQLHDDGLRVVVSGPRGDVATIGAGVRSTAGRLLAGTSRLEFGRPGAVAPIALAQLRSGQVPRALLVVPAAVVTAVAVAALAVRRRR